jgi:four helix bundle protein
MDQGRRLGKKSAAAVVHSFRDLQVWQRAMELTVTVYKLTQGFPREEVFGLSGQLRRAAVSVPSNIAEGQGRLGTREFIQFLGVARGSLCEIQTQIEIARKLGFGNSDLLDHAERACLTKSAKCCSQWWQC